MEWARVEGFEAKVPSPNKLTRTAVGNTQEGDIAKEAVEHIQECRKPFEDAIVEKKSKLNLFADYSSVFSDNKIIQLKELHLGSYNDMAMRETPTRIGEKYIILLDKDGQGNLILR